LTEDIAPADNSKYGRRFRFASYAYEAMIVRHTNVTSVTSFTHPSVFFMENISGMSGHSREQQEKFREFMVRDAGLKGKVGLPQLFHGISRWIDSGNSRISS